MNHRSSCVSAWLFVGLGVKSCWAIQGQTSMSWEFAAIGIVHKEFPVISLKKSPYMSHSHLMWITITTARLSPKVMQMLRCYVMEHDPTTKNKMWRKSRDGENRCFLFTKSKNLKDSFGNLLRCVTLPKECTTFVQGVEHLLHHDLENLLKSPQDAKKIFRQP